jgi:hypothetical protein
MSSGRLRTAKYQRVFIFGAYIPNGGTYMSYHLGCILEQEFGLQAIAVLVGRENTSFHKYPLVMPAITVEDFVKTSSDRDIILINPGFSRLLIGWRSNGLKICYVQGWNTYSILDKRFDHYVAVSEFVASFLKSVYDIKAPIIPAFVDLALLPAAVPWRNRPDGGVLPYRKGDLEIWDMSFEKLREIVAKRAPSIRIEEPFGSGGGIPHDEILKTLGSVRHVLFLSAAEGFGLVPLEAMAMGSVVLGYDGYGGRQYMRPGRNCAVASYAQIEKVAELLIDTVNSPHRAERIALRGAATARQFSYDAFRARWISEFSRILRARPGTY